MSTQHGKHVLQAMVASGTLLLLGCAASPQVGAASERNYAAEVAGTEQDATAQPNVKRPARRMRTSLSMPYFSFAQSLNPRS